MCCYPCLHRHQIHLISYGCVSFTLLTTGLVFTIFAIFQKDSQIGKVWLAGPTTMVVGLVLCGKVIIDWGPAMTHGRGGGDADSIDSRLIEQLTLSNPLVSVAGLLPNGETTYLKAPLSYDGGEAESRRFPPGRNSLSPFDYLNPSLAFPRHSLPKPGPATSTNTSGDQHSFVTSSVPQLNTLKTSSIDRLTLTERRDSRGSGDDDLAGKRGAVDFIVYEVPVSCSNSNLSSANSTQAAQNVPEKLPPASIGTQTAMSLLLPRSVQAPLAVADDYSSPLLGAQLDHLQCSCHLGGESCSGEQWRRTATYGSVSAFESVRPLEGEPRSASNDSLRLNEERRAARMEIYQGETFVMNDKTFLI